MQINENKLKELLGKVNIQEIDSACPEGQNECPVSNNCTECWIKYFQETETAPSGKPPMIKQLFSTRNACK